jgi:H+/Cl- antiporter ClcA
MSTRTSTSSTEPCWVLYGALLGIFSVIVLLVQALIGNGLRRLVPLVKNAYVRGAAAGAVVGLIAFALPLTATGGSSQLAFETENIASLGTGLLVVVLIGKMAAFTLSQEAGFLGGPVFPILFIGGTAGIVVNAVLPDIPASLAVAAMIAAVPGATLAAPVSFILLGAGVVGVGISGIAPVGIAVITAHLAVWGLDVFRETRESV